MKRKAIKLFYSDFVTELKSTDPGKWYIMAKRIGAVDQMNNGDASVECLSELNNIQAAQKIAKDFSSISISNFHPLTIPSFPAISPHYHHL